MTTDSPPLISAAELSQRVASLSGPRPVVLDCSFDLADTSAGERAFQSGHIPGARYVHLDRDQSGPKTDANGRFLGRHPLRRREEYAALFGRLGITPATLVIAYDRQGGMFAARLWWTLKWMGHSAVQLLDGGLAAWQEAGGTLAVDDEARAPIPVDDYPTREVAMPWIAADSLRDQLPHRLVIDARPPERFRGEVEPLDRVAGHIPGARNRFFKDNLQPDGRFKPAAQLRAEFEALLGGAQPESVVQQCGSGATACHNLLAMQVAGFPPTTLYSGSWSEWSAQGDDFPKAIGPATGHDSRH